MRAIIFVIHWFVGKRMIKRLLDITIYIKMPLAVGNTAKGVFVVIFWRWFSFSSVQEVHHT